MLVYISPQYYKLHNSCYCAYLAYYALFWFESVW